VGGELGLLHPDPEPHRAFLHLFGPDLVRGTFHAPEGRGKDQIPRTDEVLKVPEIVDTLGKETDLALPVLQHTLLGFHAPSARISEPPGGTNAATVSVFRMPLSPF